MRSKTQRRLYSWFFLYLFLLFPPVNVQLGGGGDEVVVLTSLELQRVWHRGEGPEGDCEESEKI
jgi:hypothetical protein